MVTVDIGIKLLGSLTRTFQKYYRCRQHLWQGASIAFLPLCLSACVHSSAQHGWRLEGCRRILLIHSRRTSWSWRRRTLLTLAETSFDLYRITLPGLFVTSPRWMRSHTHIADPPIETLHYVYQCPLPAASCLCHTNHQRHPPPHLPGRHTS